MARAVGMSILGFIIVVHNNVIKTMRTGGSYRSRVKLHVAGLLSRTNNVYASLC